MKAREVQIRTLFDGHVVYVSPSFHRPFPWGTGTCERILNALGAPVAKPYFMGALVTLDLGVKASGYRKALLIDGNLRLMSVLILILALRDTLRPIDPEAAERLDTTCFINDLPSPTPILKNILPRKDRAVFEALVLGTLLPNGRHAITDAYRLGREAFARLDRETLLESEERLLTLFTYVELALDQDEDPYPVFKLFNPGEDSFTRVGLDTYTQFSADPELMRLIASGESQEVEFKAQTILTGKHQQDGSPFGVSSVIKAVAGFMNSRNGGTLLIGVEDDGTIRGIEQEYAEIDRSKSNWDGYQLFLSNMLRAKLTCKNAIMHYQIERHFARDHEICLIRISPGIEPTYIDKRFYVRTNNQTVEMLGPDLISYVQSRFG
ncbi:MAG: putative DNA binding domain-containing protein [Kiritimatiellae bacterium]|nr:putative DNA binding domain-containing protein [Kiritimatiellia bacterium]